MSRIKSFSLMLIIIFIMAGVCGCINTNNKNTDANAIRKESLEYLDANYSDTFKAMVYSSSDWAYEYESMMFTSEKYPDGIVEVRIYKNEDGKYQFKDNYYHCFMLDSAIDYGNSLMADENVVVKVRFPQSVWSDELSGAQSFEEWKLQGAACADFFIITGDALAVDIQKEIVNKVIADKLSGTITFIVANDEFLLQDKTLDEILNNQSKFVVSKNDYHINAHFEIKTD